MLMVNPENLHLETPVEGDDNEPAASIDFTGDPPPIAWPTSERIYKPNAFWLDVAVRCRAKPGEWASVGRHSSSTVTRIRQGRLAPFRPVGAWDAKGRNIINQRAEIWVRYLGDTGEQS